MNLFPTINMFVNEPFLYLHTNKQFPFCITATYCKSSIWWQCCFFNNSDDNFFWQNSSCYPFISLRTFFPFTLLVLGSPCFFILFHWYQMDILLFLFVFFFRNVLHIFFFHDNIDYYCVLLIFIYILFFFNSINIIVIFYYTMIIF